MEYTIRRIKSDEVEDALALAWEVFLQFEAPVYSPEGTETFRSSIVENPEYIAQCKAGLRSIYGAFDGDRLAAIMGLGQSRININLAFTRKEYQRKGLATALFRCLLRDISTDTKIITLNSSPYGLPFYLHLGFVPLSEEREKDGIRYTPMKYELNEQRSV